MKDSPKEEQLWNFKLKKKTVFVNRKNGKEDSVQGKGWCIGQYSMRIDNVQLVLKRSRDG